MGLKKKKSTAPAKPDSRETARELLATVAAKPEPPPAKPVPPPKVAGQVTLLSDESAEIILEDGGALKLSRAMVRGIANLIK